MKTPDNIKEQIAKLQEELKLAEAKENKTKTIIIKELKIEVEKELHTEMDRTSKIIIPKGFRLLELPELIFIYNNYQDSFNWGKDEFFDEVVKQPIKNSKYPYFNAWLHRLDCDDGSGLNGGRLLYYDSAVRGVRFCKDLKVKK